MVERLIGMAWTTQFLWDNLAGTGWVPTIVLTIGTMPIGIGITVGPRINHWCGNRDWTETLWPQSFPKYKTVPPATRGMETLVNEAVEKTANCFTDDRFVSWATQWLKGNRDKKARQFAGSVAANANGKASHIAMFATAMVDGFQDGNLEKVNRNINTINHWIENLSE